MNPPKSQKLVHLSIAGISVALEIPDVGMRTAVLERYSEFVVTGGAVQALVHVETREGARFVPLERGQWIIELATERGRLSYRSHYDAGWIDIERGAAFVEIAPEADIENFLRVLYAQLCPGAGALLLHAAGVIRDQAGFVFFGPSGSGKTTAARSSLDHTVLSDDLVIVEIEGTAARVHGVPFRGDFREAPRVNGSAELRGLFSLVKAPRHALSAVATPEAMGRLLACAPFVMTGAASARRAMELSRLLIERVPVQALHFLPDPGFWEVV